jgi:hypothetical protein
MTEQLKACPYNCGPVDPPYVMTDDTPRHYVRCDSCGAQGPRCQTKRQAIAEWNAVTRTDDRASIIEECARAAEEHYTYAPDGVELDWPSACPAIATAIRNLAPNPSSEPSHDN